MSILIVGMEMPTSCHKCPLLYVTSICNGSTDCPLVPVPPHGRLIDADALCKTLHSLAENEYTPKVFANWIENHIDAILEAEEDE